MYDGGVPSAGRIAPGGTARGRCATPAAIHELLQLRKHELSSNASQRRGWAALAGARLICIGGIDGFATFGQLFLQQLNPRMTKLIPR